MNLKYAPYSFSKISSFVSCPQKFKFQYIDKIGVFIETPALIRGRAVHYCIENFHLDISEYSDEIKNSIKQFPEILDIVENFKKSNLGQKYLYNIEKTPINEYKIGLSKELEPTEYSKTSLFNGIVDYICVLKENNENMFNLCDFKTGKLKDSRYMDYNQLLFYAIYFFEKYKLPKIKITFIYVEHDVENDLILEYQYLNNYKRELLQNISKIEKCENFNKNITKLCDYCAFQDKCKN